jgi:hypothetical protein
MTYYDEATAKDLLEVAALRARCERLEAAVANALKHDDALKPEYQIPASLRREMAAALAGEGTK